MSIKVKNEDGLIIRITDLLSSSTVNYSNVVTLNKDVKLIDSEELSTEAEEKVYRLFGGSGLRGFVETEVNNTLIANYSFSSEEKGKPLQTFKEFSKPIEVARELVAKLKILPRRYRLTVPMPLQFSTPLIPFLNSSKLSETDAVCSSDKLPPELPLTSPNTLVDSHLFSDPFSSSLNTERKLPKENLYFTSIELGYATTRHSTIMVDHFMDKLRAFYGAASAMGMLTFNFSGPSEKKPFVLLHDKEGSGALVATVAISDDIWSRRWHSSTSGIVEITKDRAVKIKSYFDKLSILMDGTEFARRLSTACIWYFRALNSSNLLDKLLHSTIAIEVLLGDRETADSVGLTKLLGNRCAYLLGSTREGRQKIIDDFVEVYRVRSAIVHGGKHRLDKKDRNATNICLRLCASVIAKELDLHNSQDLDTVR